LILPSQTIALYEKSWQVTHSRPDITCAISQAVQETEKEFAPVHIAALNKAIKHLQATPGIKLMFPKLVIDSLKLLVYTDAAFGNNANLKSQLGYLVVLTEHSGSAAIVNYQSFKSRRIVRSSMASETLAFVHGFDSSCLLAMTRSTCWGGQSPSSCSPIPKHSSTFSRATNQRPNVAS
jgi:hypothetical protein